MGVGAAIFNTVPRESSIEKHLSEAVKKQIVLYEGCTVFHTQVTANTKVLSWECAWHV